MLLRSWLFRLRIRGGLTNDDSVAPKLAVVVLLGMGLCSCSSCVPGGGGCPSLYDGSYAGMFAYDWMATDGSTGTSSLAVNITFSCLSASNTDVSLSVTHASVDDPFFACNLGGCTPQEGDATLPRHPPTNGANPSYQGQHLQIFFVNTAVEEKLLSTNPGANALQVTSNAGLIGNSFDPAYTNATWAVTTTGAPWPGGGRTATNYKSWSLQKQ